MPLPTLIMGIFISSLYGALFHLWRGGGGGRLLLYLIFSWIGFWLGHFVGNLTGITFASLGALKLGTATLGSPPSRNESGCHMDQRPGLALLCYEVPVRDPQRSGKTQIM